MIIMTKFNILLIFLLVSCNTYSVKDEDIIYKNNRYYNRNGELLNGKIVTYRSDGTKRSLYHYKKGIHCKNWVMYGFGNDIVMDGYYYNDIHLSNYLSKFKNIDYILFDKYKEGNEYSLSLYIHCYKKDTMSNILKFYVSDYMEKKI